MSNQDERRRTIQELIARYELEPDIFDVYVEGDFDKVVIENFFHECGIKSAKAYLIKTVEVPASLTETYGQKVNNKGRVVTLSLEISKNFFNGSASMIGVIDADDDYHTDNIIVCDCLLYTDYACMEMYFLSQSVMEKLFTNYVRHPVSSIPKMLDNLSHILQEAFLFRIAHQQICPDVAWIDIKSCCTASKKDRALEFDSSKVWSILRGRGAPREKVKDFENTVNVFRGRFSNEPRMQIHGHDLVNTLGMYIKDILKSDMSIDSKTLERVLCLCLDYGSLASESLFSKLLNKGSYGKL